LAANQRKIKCRGSMQNAIKAVCNSGTNRKEERDETKWKYQENIRKIAWKTRQLQPRNRSGNNSKPGHLHSLAHWHAGSF